MIVEDLGKLPFSPKIGSPLHQELTLQYMSLPQLLLPTTDYYFLPPPQSSPL